MFRIIRDKEFICFLGGYGYRGFYKFGEVIVLSGMIGRVGGLGRRTFFELLIVFVGFLVVKWVVLLGLVVRVCAIVLGLRFCFRRFEIFSNL